MTLPASITTSKQALEAAAEACAISEQYWHKVAYEAKQDGRDFQEALMRADTAWSCRYNIDALRARIAPAPDVALPPLRVIYSWATEYHAGWELCLYGAGSVSFRNEFTSAIWAVPEGLIHWATARIAPAPDPNSVVEKK